MKNEKVQRRAKIKRRVRKKVYGTSERPRLSVFRSNKQIYAQIINDDEGLTIVSSTSYKKGFTSENKTEQAKKVGEEIAKLAQDKGVKSVVFDRNGYLYHGRVKALGDAARENGLIF